MSLQMHSAVAAPYFPMVVSTASPFPQLITEMDKDTCGNICEFDEWFQRAQCEEKGLSYVPLSYSCEGAVMLELQNNRISQLTRSCTIGYDLVKTLDLSRNKLTFIQYGTFMDMNNLQNILLSHNLLKVVVNLTFTGTEDSLKRIFFNHNKIKTIHKDAFRGLIKVVVLHLSYNRIELIHESTFRGMHALCHLHLSDNNLHTLSRKTFQGLTHIERISLSDNNLKWIPKGLFSGLTSLKEITLGGNQLVTIPHPKRLGINTKLELLDLRNNNFNATDEIIPLLNISDRLLIEGNHFNCDCAYIEIREWYQNNSDTEHQVQRDQIGCFWNESFISIDENFPVHCGARNVGYNLDQDEPQHEKQDHTLSAQPAPLTSQWQMPTSTEIPSTVLPMPLKEGCTLQNQKLERRQRIMLIYCLALLTFFFILWIIKTYIVNLKRKWRNQIDEENNNR